MKYPRCVYLIFPRKENGLVAGVYVGSALDLERRIDCHTRCFYKGRKQDTLHRLMRTNGYYYGIVDNISDETQKMKEHDWIDYFIEKTDLEIFNTIICKEADWHRISNPQKRIDKKFGVTEEGKPFWERKITLTKRIKEPKKKKVEKVRHMRVTSKQHYPNLVKQFKSEEELAKLIFRSPRTVRRSISGNRPFDEYEIKRIEEYTGLSRHYLLRREIK